MLPSFGVMCCIGKDNAYRPTELVTENSYREDTNCIMLFMLLCFANTIYVK